MSFQRSTVLAATAVAWVSLLLSDGQAASPRQSALLGPITDYSIDFGGGPDAKLNSSAPFDSHGVLLNFDTDVAGGERDQVAFQWDSFSADLSGHNSFSLNFNPTPDTGVGGAQLFLLSADPLDPGNSQFVSSGFHGVSAGVDNLLSIDLGGVNWPQNITSFGIQIFTNGESAAGASGVLSTAADYTHTEDMLFDFNSGLDGWGETWDGPTHVHSWVDVGAADGTPALGIERNLDGFGGFTWGTRREFGEDEVADIQARMNAANAIAFDITVHPYDPFPDPVPSWVNFFIAIDDDNGWHQAGQQDFNATPESPETNTFFVALNTFLRWIEDEETSVPLTDLGVQTEEGNYLQILIASNSDAGGIFEIDNFRLVNLSAISSADFDLDSQVDSNDLIVWQDAFGGSSNDGDADFDGVTDGHDFLVWQRQFSGGSALLGNVVEAVPEPSTGLLVLAFSCLALRARRRAW